MNRKQADLLVAVVASVTVALPTSDSVPMWVAVILNIACAFVAVVATISVYLDLE